MEIFFLGGVTVCPLSHFMQDTAPDSLECITTTPHHVYYYRFQRYQRECKACLESQNAEHIAVPLPQLSVCLLLSLIFRKE